MDKPLVRNSRKMRSALPFDTCQKILFANIPQGAMFLAKNLPLAEYYPEGTVFHCVKYSHLVAYVLGFITPQDDQGCMLAELHTYVTPVHIPDNFMSPEVYTELVVPNGTKIAFGSIGVHVSELVPGDLFIGIWPPTGRQLSVMIDSKFAVDDAGPFDAFTLERPYVWVATILDIL